LVIVCRPLGVVHLESTGRLDTGDLILALLGFGVRGRCSNTIPSDNGGLFESGRAEVLDSDQKALGARFVGVDWSLVESKFGVSHGESFPFGEPEFSGLADAFVVLESINLPPMKSGVDWKMIKANRILKAGIYSQGILLDESKDAQVDIEKLPGWLTDILMVVTYTPGGHGFVKNLMVNRLALLISPKTDHCCECPRPQGIGHECIAKADGAVRQVRVRILSAKGEEHVFLELPIRKIILFDVMWVDPQLELPIDAAEALNWHLKGSGTAGSDNLTQKLKDNRELSSISLQPTLESFKTTTTARVDQNVETIGRFITDEMGPTTRVRRKLLEDCEADEVERQLQIIEEGKCPDSY
jgi:hypothetical protein